LADKRVDERGFARVWAAYDRDETGFEGHGRIDCTPLMCEAEAGHKIGGASRYA